MSLVHPSAVFAGATPARVASVFHDWRSVAALLGHDPVVRFDLTAYWLASSSFTLRFVQACLRPGVKELCLIATPQDNDVCWVDREFADDQVELKRRYLAARDGELWYAGAGLWDHYVGVWLKVFNHFIPQSFEDEIETGDRPTPGALFLDYGDDEDPADGDPM